MAERIVSMHAAHRSGKEVIDGFLSRPTAGGIYYQSMFPDSEDLKTLSAPMLCHFGTEDHGRQGRK